MKYMERYSDLLYVLKREPLRNSLKKFLYREDANFCIPGTPLRAFRNQFTGHTVMYTGHNTQQKLYTSLRVINSRR